MKALGWAVVLVALAVASVAEAADHRMKVGEVLLSSGGSTERQYIELWNTAAAGEPFPGTTYQVTVYDTDKVVVDTVVIGDLPTTKRFLISTAMADASFGTEGDAVLGFTLPAVGAACFERAAGQPIHCLSWGCPNQTPTAPSTSEGDAPANGESLSIDEGTADGGNDALYEIAAPTPGEANASGTESTACPAVVPDAGPSGTPDAGGSGASPDSGAGGGGGGDDGCAATSMSSTSPVLAFALLLALVGLRRRRR